MNRNILFVLGVIIIFLCMPRIKEGQENTKPSCSLEEEKEIKRLERRLKVAKNECYSGSASAVLEGFREGQTVKQKATEAAEVERARQMERGKAASARSQQAAAARQAAAQQAAAAAAARR